MNAKLDNIFAGTKTINKHPLNFMFWYMVKKYQSYQTRARANTFEASGALGYSAWNRNGSNH